MAKLAETSFTVIGMNLMVMNLEKLWRLGNGDRFLLLISFWKVGLEGFLQTVRYVIRELYANGCSFQTQSA